MSSHNHKFGLHQKFFLELVIVKYGFRNGIFFLHTVHIKTDKTNNLRGLRRVEKISSSIAMHSKLQCNGKDQWFLSRKQELVLFEGLSGQLLRGRVISEKCDFYIFPVFSSRLNIFLSNGVPDISERLFNSEDYLVKMFKIPYMGEKCVFSPVKHTYAI